MPRYLGRAERKALRLIDPVAYVKVNNEAKTKKKSEF